MKVFRRLPRRGPASRPLALAVGVFDGVHLGHQAILQAALRQARRLGGAAGVLTFDGPPERLLAPDYCPPQLITLEEKLEQLAALGVDEAYVVRFNRAFAAMSAEAFVERCLVGRLRARVVVVGPDFVFGRRASGDLELLRRLGGLRGLETLSVKPLSRGGRPVSSTRIRLAVQDGRMREAARLLGRPWRLRGVVVKGRQRGRSLGFPTANIASRQEVLPQAGVWAGRARLLGPAGGAEKWLAFAANIGTRPTFGSGNAAVELHLLGFRGRIYGRSLEAEFIRYLRPERKFSSGKALAAQIKKDVAAALKAA